MLMRDYLKYLLAPTLRDVVSGANWDGDVTEGCARCGEVRVRTVASSDHVALVASVLTRLLAWQKFQCLKNI